MSTRQVHQSASEHKQSSLWLASFICILATSFLLYEFILQVSPSVMTEALMYDLGLSAAGLGTTMAFYYYAKTAMQLPAGILFDRFGPRILLTIATLTCAVGALTFGIATEPSAAAIGRFLMGAGSAFAFTGGLVLIANWFPPHYFAVLTGIVQLSSCIGATAGQVPLVPILNQWGWRNTSNGLGIIGIILAVLIWLIVRDAPQQKPRQSNSKTSLKQEYKKLMQVLNNRQTWWIALYSFMVWAPMTAFVGLWAIPFLTKAYSLTEQQATIACSIIWLTNGVGSILLGWWSDNIKQRRLPLTASASLGIISLSLLIYYPLSPIIFYISLFMIGLASTGQALAFGVVKDNNRAEVTGTAIGFNNMAVVASGAAFQPLLGFLLGWSWDGQLDYLNNAIYSVNTYQKAFILLPLCYLGAVLISHFLLRETHCRPQTR